MRVCSLSHYITLGIAWEKWIKRGQINEIYSLLTRDYLGSSSLVRIKKNKTENVESKRNQSTDLIKNLSRTKIIVYMEQEYICLYRI